MMRNGNKRFILNARWVAFCIFSLISLKVVATIIEVPNTVPSIDDAVDMASNGDTILVYPGIYQEHVMIYDKVITLGSLYLITQDTSYISQTIIEYPGTFYPVISISNVADTTCMVCGFTLRNSGGGISCNDSDPLLSHLVIEGNSDEGGIQLWNSSPTLRNVIIRNNYAQYSGGGIFIRQGSIPVIRNCLIENNTAEYGGGIYCREGSIDIAGTTIRYNKAIQGGGIFWTYLNQSPVFSSTNRCNLYCNEADIGNDICIGESVYGNVILDTFSVLHPTNFFATPLLQFNYEINTGKITQTDADLFVSPDGDDNNTGLTEYDPLRTLHWANSIIRSDSNSHHTIYLLEGLYSLESNGETFPVYFQDYTNYQGMDMETVILDAMGGSAVAKSWFNNYGTISKMTIQHGIDNGLNMRSVGCTVDQVIFRENTGEWGGGISCFGGDLQLQNCHFNQNTSILYGGGVYIEHGNPVISDCEFRKNEALNGGAIFSRDAHLSISGISVSENIASTYGGGICTDNWEMEFDSANRSNIYLNTAILGNDIYSYGLWGITKVWADTFTVLYPTDYHVTPLNEFEFDILHGIYQQADHDLYVSPEGDNGNSGISQDEPLKTMDYALCIMRTSDTLQRSLHLLEGIFSPSTNQEKFPIGIPKYYSLSGTSRDEVVLNPEGGSRAVYFRDNHHSKISDLTITGGMSDYAAGIYMSKSSPELENILITGNTANYGAGVYMYDSDPRLVNLKIYENHAYYAGAGLYFSDSSPQIINTLICKNSSLNAYGGGIYCYTSRPSLVNTTLADNLAVSGGGIYIREASYTEPSSVQIINSILWDNQPNQITIYSPEDEDTVSLFYCDIMGGEDGITIDEGGIVVWLDGNIDLKPGFDLNGQFPYALTEYSPCVDRGLQDTSYLGLPPYDIALNNRIWDGDQNGSDIIDMGAYEFGAPIWVGVEDEMISMEHQELYLTAYPNPSTGKVFFVFETCNSDRIYARIYSTKGEVVDFLSFPSTRGAHVYCYDGSILDNGIYLLELNSGSNAGITRFVISH